MWKCVCVCVKEAGRGSKSEYEWLRVRRKWDQAQRNTEHAYLTVNERHVAISRQLTGKKTS